MTKPSQGFGQQLDLRVVTPLFLGGASTTGPPEHRAPSLKGVMRFWHRAAGPSALKSEGCLFGSSSGKQAGQARFLLQVEAIPAANTVSSGFSELPLKYLGYGVEGKRSYIIPGTDLPIRLVFHPSLSVQQKDTVWRSLELMSYFGGLGSRSRRGFGSVVLPHTVAEGMDDLADRISRITSSLEKPVYEDVTYTMFSQASRVLILPGDGGWRTTLAKAGRLLQIARSAQGDPLPDYPWSRQDAALVGRYAATGEIERAPARAAFGLPHNYYFPDSGITVNVGSGRDRRASPLFLHVHPLVNGEHAIVITFLPAPLLPEGKKIGVSATRRSTRVQPSQRVFPPPDFGAVEGFLEHLMNLPEIGAREVRLSDGHV